MTQLAFVASATRNYLLWKAESYGMKASFAHSASHMQKNCLVRASNASSRRRTLGLLPCSSRVNHLRVVYFISSIHFKHTIHINYNSLPYADIPHRCACICVCGLFLIYCMCIIICFLKTYYTIQT